MVGRGRPGRRRVVVVATEPVGKTQSIRLLDVLVIGPAMIFAATRRRPPLWLSTAMVVMGAGTIIYNGLNYLAVEKQRRVNHARR